ncbi:unnamed protein product, partial [Didymodactylos carnosus]
ILPSIQSPRFVDNDDINALVITNRKPEWNATPKVGSLNNATHKPGGGSVKIANQKLQWTAKSKVGSLENAHHKAGGGTVKIESKKLDFKDKAKPKTDSGLATVNSEQGGASNSGEASATATGDPQKDDDTHDEVFEPQQKK